jgi:signal transduction histidine kinase
MSTEDSNHTQNNKSTGTRRRTLEESDQITEKVERSMRLLAVIGRVVGWVWMLMLVIATLKVDAGANRTIVIGSMVLATAWTVFSMWAARSRQIFGSLQFVLADAIVILLVGAASWAAGADNLFHGGYLIPTLAVAAYGLNLYGATLIAGVIAVEQAAILFSWGVGPVPALSSLGFILWGIVFGWLFATIRRTDAYRRATVDELLVERERSVRKSERLELGNRLHDSALQTLLVIDSDAENSDRVRTLARRQSRELRKIVDIYAPDGSETLKDELVRVADEVEELFDVSVSAVVRTDVQMNDTLVALVDAVRESMTNAAKHSGTNRIDLYAAIENGAVAIYVRDEGRGFDPDHVTEGHGLEHSVRGRVRDVGGDVSVTSRPGQGTEVRISATIQAAVS